MLMNVIFPMRFDDVLPVPWVLVGIIIVLIPWLLFRYQLSKPTYIGDPVVAIELELNAGKIPLFSTIAAAALVITLVKEAKAYNVELRIMMNADKHLDLMQMFDFVRTDDIWIWNRGTNSTGTQ